MSKILNDDLYRRICNKYQSKNMSFLIEVHRFIHQNCESFEKKFFNGKGVHEIYQENGENQNTSYAK